MKESEQELTHTLQDIKQMMERSSRFISLSGLSGIAAGCCALVGAYVAYRVMEGNTLPGKLSRLDPGYRPADLTVEQFTNNELFYVAAITFIAALVLAFIFTYIRSLKTKTPIWGTTAKRLMWNVSVPLIAGGLYLLKLIEDGAYAYIASGSLIFYGLALLNASKFTLKEIKYLGYGQLLLGVISLYGAGEGNGLYFWALGFGVLHIIYGAVMWWRYERTQTD